MWFTISLRTGFWAVVWGFSQLFPIVPIVLTIGRAEEPTQPRDRIVLTETYNAVTNIYFTNVATHSGSPNPDLAKRRFRADLTYWLMAAKYYDQGQLSIGNPELVDLVRAVGSQDRPAGEPTTLSAMAYGIARAALDRYPVMKKVEVHLIHFPSGLSADDETEDNHVVHVVLTR